MAVYGDYCRIGGVDWNDQRSYNDIKIQLGNKLGQASKIIKALNTRSREELEELIIVEKKESVI